MLIGLCRLQKLAVTIKLATIFAFYKSMVKRKYSLLYANKKRKAPARKSQDQALIGLVVDMKKRNPSFGSGQISMQILEAFEINISCFAVGRLLRKMKHNLPTGDGLSWLTFIGPVKDSLWSRNAVQ